MASRALVVFFALSFLLAGCIGAKQDAVKPAETKVNNTSTQERALPDGRDFKAAQETTKVENSSTGGIAHKHDYWHGRETVTVFDSDINVGLVPVFERGDNSHVLEGFINLDTLPGSNPAAPALIFEGAGTVTFTLTSAPAWATNYQLTFRTAGKDWSSWQPIAVGSPFVYKPAKIETDMPHSERSLWNWKLQATSPVPVTSDAGLTSGLPAPVGQTFHAKIVITKARDVDSWPPHPDFYSGQPERFVLTAKEGKTNVQNAADVEIYGVEPDQLSPDKLISMGTGVLDVYVNITQLTLPPGVPNGGFTLYWRTANTTPNALGIFSLANTTDKTTKAYWHLNVNNSVVDSPYQPTSRFGFKVLANPIDDSVVACYRCMPYTIDYTMTIIARPSADPMAGMVM